MNRLTERTLPGATAGGLMQLVADLAAVGVDVDCADRFEELAATAGMLLTPPAHPERLLDLDDDEVENYLRAVALHDALAERVRTRHAPDLLVELCAEFAAAIRDDADRIVGHLNARFVPTFAEVRALRARGVTESDTASTIIKRDHTTIAAWNRHRETLAPALDSLAELRFDLSRVAYVAPGSPRLAGDLSRLWAACLAPAVPYDLPGEDAAARWLRIAANEGVHLAVPSQHTEADALALAVPSLNLDLVRAVARSRAADAAD